jgi:simple sugar transport system permease protein
VIPFADDLAAATARTATPLLLAALGETIAERSGVLNVGLEGTMLAGAFAGFLAGHASGDPLVGLAAAVAAGTAVAAAFAAIAVLGRVDQVVAGLFVNLLAAGMTALAFREIFRDEVFAARSTAVRSVPFREVAFPVLDGVPVLGAFLRQTPLTWAALALVPATAFVLTRTRAGLAVRAAGEAPGAAAAAGVRVLRVRFAACLAMGALAGAAGASLTLAQSDTFVEGMTAGRGFIALAIVIFGRWRPAYVLLAAVFFGGVSALQFRFQAIGLAIPHTVFLALPYVVTLACLFFVGKRSAGPRALATPFPKDAT